MNVPSRKNRKPHHWQNDWMNDAGPGAVDRGWGGGTVAPPQAIELAINICRWRLFFRFYLYIDFLFILLLFLFYFFIFQLFTHRNLIFFWCWYLGHTAFPSAAGRLVIVFARCSARGLNSTSYPILVPHRALLMQCSSRTIGIEWFDH